MSALVGRSGRRDRRVGAVMSAPARRVWSVAEVRALGVRTDLVTAGEILGIGRTVAHQLARQGTFPTPVLRVGHKYVVPVAPLLELLGVSGMPIPSKGPIEGCGQPVGEGPGTGDLACPLRVVSSTGSVSADTVQRHARALGVRLCGMGS